jgi:hypothetical protein
MAMLTLHGSLIGLGATDADGSNVEIELDNGYSVDIGRLSEDQVRGLKPLLFERITLTIEAAE